MCERLLSCFPPSCVHHSTLQSCLLSLLQVWTRARPNPYDYANLLTSFELQPSTRSAQVPPARHRAAAAFVRTGAVPRYPAGVLVMFGGTTDPWDVDPNGLMGDLWLYDMATHVWTRVVAQGLDPAPRSGGAMTSLGTMVSLVKIPVRCSNTVRACHLGVCS